MLELLAAFLCKSSKEHLKWDRKQFGKIGTVFYSSGKHDKTQSHIENGTKFPSMK